MDWCWPGDNPLFKPTMVWLLRHICITLSQWVGWPILIVLLAVLVKRQWAANSHSWDKWSGLTRFHQEINQLSGSHGMQLTLFGLVTQMASLNLVNIGYGNGLLPDGTKPLPKPMLTYHQWGLVGFTLGNFKCSWHHKLCYTFKVRDTYPREQWVKSPWPSDLYTVL